MNTENGQRSNEYGRMPDAQREWKLQTGSQKHVIGTRTLCSQKAVYLACIYLSAIHP